MEKRRAYLYDPSAVVPKTTAWRYRKRFAANSVSGQNVFKKRKNYHRKSCRIPKSTLWRWKKKYDAVESNGEGENSESGYVAEGMTSECGSEEYNSENGNTEKGSESSVGSDETVNFDIGGESVDMSGIYYDEQDMGNTEKVVQNSDEGKSADEINISDEGSNEVEGNSIERSDIEGSSIEGNNVDEYSDGGSNFDGNTVEESGSEASSENESDIEGHESELENYDEVAINKDLSNSFSTSYPKPLFKNAPLTLEESIFSTYVYSIRNKLSYQATSQLLQLMQLHFPKPNQYPLSLHTFKKHFSTMETLEITKFCLSCMEKIPQDASQCIGNRCAKAGESHFTLLPFENQVADVCSGKFKGNLYRNYYGCSIDKF